MTSYCPKCGSEVDPEEAEDEKVTCQQCFTELQIDEFGDTAVVHQKTTESGFVRFGNSGGYIKW